MHAGQATAQQQQQTQHTLQVSHEPAETLKLPRSTGLAHHGLQGRLAAGPLVSHLLQPLLLGAKFFKHALEEVS